MPRLARTVPVSAGRFMQGRESTPRLHGVNSNLRARPDVVGQRRTRRAEQVACQVCGTGRAVRVPRRAGSVPGVWHGACCQGPAQSR